MRGLVLFGPRQDDGSPRATTKCRNRTWLAREMFEKAQWAQASEATSSLAQMAARSANVGSPDQDFRSKTGRRHTQGSQRPGCFRCLAITRYNLRRSCREVDRVAGKIDAVATYPSPRFGLFALTEPARCERRISQPSIIRRPLMTLTARWAMKLRWLNKATECSEITYKARWYCLVRIRTLNHDHIRHCANPTPKGLQTIRQPG